MATLKVQPIRLQKNYTENHGHHGAEAASQTFKDGNLIYPDASGNFIATPAGATAASAKNRVAAAAGQNLAAPLRRVPYVDPNIANFFEVTAGGAVSSTSNIKVGATYGYAIDGTTGFGYLLLTDTTNAVFRIEDATPVTGVIGDTNVRVYASILATAR